METVMVGKKLVELCRKGDFEGATRELYSPAIVSLEGFPMEGGMPREVKGMEAIAAKGKWWSDNHTVHGMTVNGPFCSLEKFVVEFDFDVTFKPTGERKKMHEVGVYTVQGGKIVHEEFLYAM